MSLGTRGAGRGNSAAARRVPAEGGEMLGGRGGEVNRATQLAAARRARGAFA
jgi:hypothetical protein